MAGRFNKISDNKIESDNRISFDEDVGLSENEMSKQSSLRLLFMKSLSSFEFIIVVRDERLDNRTNVCLWDSRSSSQPKRKLHLKMGSKRCSVFTDQNRFFSLYRSVECMQVHIPLQSQEWTQPFREGERERDIGVVSDYHSIQYNSSPRSHRESAHQVEPH